MRKKKREKENAWQMALVATRWEKLGVLRSWNIDERRSYFISSFCVTWKLFPSSSYCLTVRQTAEAFEIPKRASNWFTPPHLWCERNSRRVILEFHKVIWTYTTCCTILVNLLDGNSSQTSFSSLTWFFISKFAI